MIPEGEALQLVINDHKVDVLGASPRKTSKRMSKKKFAALKASLERFSQVQPVILNTRTGQVLSGSRQVSAAAEIGIDELAAIEVDLSPEEQLAFSLALRKLVGEWDEEAIATLLTPLDKDQLATTGFDRGDLDRILDLCVAEVSPEDTESVESIVAAVSETKCIIRFGDLKISVPQINYYRWIADLGNGKGGTCQSLGREVAKRCGINNLLAS
jgi:hypothetical protein